MVVVNQPARPSFGHKRYVVRRIAIIVIIALAWAWIATAVLFMWHSSKQVPTAATNVVKPQKHPHLRAGDEPYYEEQRVMVLKRPKYETPTLLFTCSRAEYLDQALADVIKYIPKTCEVGCPLIISQDGDNEAVKEVIQKYQATNKHGIPIVHIQHEPLPRTKNNNNAYQTLAVHYGWALEQTFSGNATGNHYPKPKRLIILEEDLRVAPDFFDYFKAMAPLLDSDSTLMAISAFNDNGKESNVQDAARVVRSDFFPGLGWMMTKALWDNELASKWPSGYWDDWLRDPEQRRGRQFLRPEVSRTFHFGTKGGASGNQFGELLSKIALNHVKVDWSRQDLTHLYPSAFDREYWDLISTAKVETEVNVAKEESKFHNIRIEYANFAAFKKLAQLLDLMDDEKAGVPRTAYKGVVELRPHGHHILFLTPPLGILKNELHQSRQ